MDEMAALCNESLLVFQFSFFPSSLSRLRLGAPDVKPTEIKKRGRGY